MTLTPMTRMGERIGMGWGAPHGTPRPEMDVGEHTRDGKRA